MKWLLLTLGLLLVPTTRAIDRHYLADMHESRWTVRTEKLLCEITHIIPQYGIARFRKAAGEEAHFTLSAFKASNRQQAIAIDSVNPEWYFSNPLPATEKNLGSAKDNGSNVPLVLNRIQTLRLLYELENGRRPTFSYKDAADATEILLVSLSPVNFRAAHKHFNYCIAELLPFGFDDVSFVNINFESNSDTLSEATKSRLDKVIKYIRIDSTVKRLVLGGHTDSIGSKRYNTDLSEFRTYRVLDYLTSKGVPESMIEHTSYGAEKPLKSNTTDRGRAINRRVTLEVVRD